MNKHLNKYPKLKEYIKYVKTLDDINKYKVYMNYYNTHLGMKHSCIIYSKNSCLKGMGTPDKIIGNYNYFYLWKDIKCIESLEEFFDIDKNVRIIDNGKEWESNGNAQRYRVDLFGAYNWLRKFEDIIE